MDAEQVDLLLSPLITPMPQGDPIGAPPGRGGKSVRNLVLE
jgi:hypothetical protein